jgi:hypothetical protein
MAGVFHRVKDARNFDAMIAVMSRGLISRALT